MAGWIANSCWPARRRREEVRAEVRRRINELAPGGGYIAAPSHSVPYDPAILTAMNDEIARYGRAIYARQS
jgi:hypothetical protein